MRKLLTILFILPLIFSSCKKEDDNPISNSNNSSNPITPSLGLVGYGKYNYQLYKTTDGGVNWGLINPITLSDISFPSNDIGYGKYNYQLYKTTDGGVNWGLINPITLSDISFP